MTTATVTRLPIPDGFQLSLLLDDNGQQAVIVLGSKGAGSWTDASTVEVWRDAAWNQFRLLCHPTVRCTGAIGRGVMSGGAAVFEVGAPVNAAGTATGLRTVAAASTLVKWGTATGGRSGKGRTFLPGLTADNTAADGRTYAAGYSTTVANLAANYLADANLAAKGLDPAVLSFRKGVAYPITAGGLGAVVGIQRRRMRG